MKEVHDRRSRYEETPELVSGPATGAPKKTPAKKAPKKPSTKALERLAVEEQRARTHVLHKGVIDARGSGLVDLVLKVTRHPFLVTQTSLTNHRDTA